MPDYGDQILTNRKILVLGQETNKGEKLTLTNAHIRSTALEASVEVNPATFNRNLLLPTFSQVASLKGSPIGKLTCKTEIKGSGNTYTTLGGVDAVPAATAEPACGRLLRACGFLLTSAADGGYFQYYYKPTSTPLATPVRCPTWTMGVWNDGVMETIYGAKGNARITCRKDEPVMLENECLGIYDAMVDKTLASWGTITFESSIPPVAKNVPCTIVLTGGTVGIDLASFEIDMGNQVALQTSINSATGLLWTEIVGRKPTMRLDPAQHVPKSGGVDLNGEVQWYDRLLSGDAIGTTGVITIGPFPTTGNFSTFTITIPNARVLSARPGDREGLRVSEIELELCGSTYAGEDEVQFNFKRPS